MNFKHGHYSTNKVINPDNFLRSQEIRKAQLKLEKILQAYWQPDCSKKFSEEELRWANEVIKKEPVWAKSILEKYNKPTR